MMQEKWFTRSYSGKESCKNDDGLERDTNGDKIKGKKSITALQKAQHIWKVLKDRINTSLLQDSKLLVCIQYTIIPRSSAKTYKTKTWNNSSFAPN